MLVLGVTSVVSGGINMHAVAFRLAWIPVEGFGHRRMYTEELGIASRLLVIPAPFAQMYRALERRKNHRDVVPGLY